MAPPKIPLNARLKRLTARRGPKQCWPWLGSINRSLGYGIMSGDYVPGQSWKPNLYAHRVAYEVYKGPIPPGCDIAHLCHNRTCVNPAHLEAVSRGENVKQTVAAKNHANLAMDGTKNPQAKLTRRQVKEIRTKSMRLCDAIKHYGVSETVILRIRNGTAWTKPCGRRVVYHR